MTPLSTAAFRTDQVPVYEFVSFEPRPRASVMDELSFTQRDWMVVGLGSAFFAIAGLLTGAWLQVQV